MIPRLSSRLSPQTALGLCVVGPLQPVHATNMDCPVNRMALITSHCGWCVCVLFGPLQPDHRAGARVPGAPADRESAARRQSRDSRRLSPPLAASRRQSPLAASRRLSPPVERLSPPLAVSPQGRRAARFCLRLSFASGPLTFGAVATWAGPRGRAAGEQQPAVAALQLVNAPAMCCLFLPRSVFGLSNCFGDDSRRVAGLFPARTASAPARTAAPGERTAATRPSSFFRRLHVCVFLCLSLCCCSTAFLPVPYNQSAALNSVNNGTAAMVGDLARCALLSFTALSFTVVFKQTFWQQKKIASVPSVPFIYLFLNQTF